MVGSCPYIQDALASLMPGYEVRVIEHAIVDTPVVFLWKQVGPAGEKVSWSGKLCDYIHLGLEGIAMAVLGEFNRAETCMVYSWEGVIR